MFVTEYEKKHYQQQLSGKTYDTTTILQVSQEELTAARQAQLDHLNKEKNKLETALKTKNDPKDQKKLNDLKQKIALLTNKAMYSIENGGMLLTRERGQELASTHVITKRLRKSDIYSKFKELEKTKQPVTYEDKVALVREAVQAEMNRVYNDSTVFNKATDLLTVNGIKPTRGTTKAQQRGIYQDELKDFADEFLAEELKVYNAQQQGQQYTSKFNVAEDMIFDILQKKKLPISHVSTLGKYVSPGGQIRAMSGIFDRSLLPYLEDVMGFKRGTLAGVEGIVERNTLSNKNLIDYASGLFNNALIRKMGKVKFDKRQSADLKDFRESIVNQLPVELQKTVTEMMQISGQDTFFTQSSDEAIQRDFKKYLPAILQAVGLADNWEETIKENGKKVKVKGGINTRIYANADDKQGKLLTGLSAADIYYLLTGNDVRPGSDLLARINAQTGLNIQNFSDLRDMKHHILFL